MEHDINFTDLQDDGDALELDDTHRLVLHVEVDQDASINDFDCYGKVSEERSRTNDYGHEMRPSDMDGSARKLWYGNDGPWWWMPYREGHKVYDDKSTVDQVRELLAFGFKEVGLELQQLVTDERGVDHWVEVATEWIGGVDSFYPELVEELASQLGLPDLANDSPTESPEGASR